MPDLRALVADDEPLARELLRGLLEAIPGVEVVGEAVNGRDAVGKVNDLQPDVVFLDVQMPGLDGFGVVRALQGDAMPLIVFATAYDRYALEAFDVHAVDYLLKPFQAQRLRLALERARQRLAGDEPAGSKSAILSAGEQLAAREAEGADVDQRLVIKSANDAHFIDQDRIHWIDAAGDYMCIHVEGETLISRTTMKDLMDKLDPGKFVRIHRSTIVNITRITRITPLKKGESMLQLEGETTLKVSRSYRHAVRHLVP